jgi:flagellar hook assembly protein FlgD
MTYSVLSGGVSIRIYALNGRPVKTLVDEGKSIGTYTATWDGRNEEGKIVASGIYLVRVVATGVKTTQKIAVVK